MKALAAGVLMIMSLAAGVAVAADQTPVVTQTQAELAPDNYLVQLCVATLPGATNLAGCASNNGAAGH